MTFAVRTTFPSLVCIKFAVFLSVGFLFVAQASDWPELNGGPGRNNVSVETGLIAGFEEPEDRRYRVHTRSGDARRIGLQGNVLPKLRNVFWSAKLGSAAFGSPVVANGRVFIGGAMDWPGDYKGRTTAALWCFKESDGSLLWRFRSTFIEKYYNRSFGITATPTIEGDRVYVVSHLGDVLCLDVHGLANGNDGPFQEERDLLTQGRVLVKSEVGLNGKTENEITPGTAQELDPTDGDVIWRFDMHRELNCRFYNALTSAVVIRGDLLYLGTGATGVGSSKPFPSPVFIALDKKTGRLVAVNDQEVKPPRYHGAHSSPAFGVVNGKELLVYANGRGVCHAFDPVPVPGKDGMPGILKLVWFSDCTLPTIYNNNENPRAMSFEVVATPVVHKNRVYIALGNDLAGSGKSAGKGRLACIDATKTGDITQSGRIWNFDSICSSGSSVAIADNLLFTADAAGNILCLDAETGKEQWRHQYTDVWNSPLVADGKLYVATCDRGLLIMAASKEKRVISEGGGLGFSASPAVANGVMYVATHQHLYALKSE